MHLANRPGSGRPGVTSRRQDQAIRLAHLRSRHITATETALNTVDTNNPRISPKFGEIYCVRVVFMPVLRMLVRP